MRGGDAQTDCFVVVKESHALVTSGADAGVDGDRDGRDISRAQLVQGKRTIWIVTAFSLCDLRGEKRAVRSRIEERSAT